MMDAALIERAFIAACHAELQALKPGNVHVHAGGHGMSVADFEASAAAAAPYIARDGARVGARILGAVEATRQAVGQNTNLGIILLCAPLAAAAEQASSGSLRPALAATLAGLDREDAALAFRAITLANPGGLGEAPEHDVRGPAAVPLVEAMRLAAPRDRVAYQYASGFADIFDLGLPAARAAADLTDAAAKIYWRFLTAIPDSHVARKFGAAKAEAVRGMARAVDVLLEAAETDEGRVKHFLNLDALLKSDGVNPGTSADLTVATLFAFLLLLPSI
jgi:triphosphoribosyl-dephospho-CoA synthase